MASEIRLAGGAGEYMDSATVVSWSVATGQTVKAGDVIVVVETAKAATEIEAEQDGVLIEIVAPVGAEIGIGALLGRIGEADEVEQQVTPQAPAAAAVASTTPDVDQADGVRRIAISPLARRLARQAGLDIGTVAGTGPGGRIKSRDIERALSARPAQPRSPRLRNAGDASPIVFIHGFGANAASWNALRGLVEPVMSSLALDLPGHGGRAAGRAGDLDGLADDLAEQLDGLGVRDCHLVGHSLGGAVATVLAERPELRVRSLTLIAPAGLGPEMDGAYLDGFLGATTTEALTPWLERLVATPASLPRGLAAAVLREREQQGVLAPQKALALRLFAAATQSFGIGEGLARLSMPLRVIWGRHDRIIPPHHARGLPAPAALHLIDGAGHVPHVEAVELVARLVLQTVRSAG